MLVAVLSVKGSPGVTTFAVALAAWWPTDTRVLLVEADPSGGDLAIRFGLPSTPGLLSLAATARHSTDPVEAWRHAQTLPGGLPVVCAPDADRVRAALPAVVSEPSTDGADGGVLHRAAAGGAAAVIVDCGRADATSLALPIIQAADTMVVLTGAGADNLAHLAHRLPTISRWNTRPGVVLVGDGYSAAEVTRELPMPVLGHVPHDPRGAATLRGRPSALSRARRGPARSAVGRVAATVAALLAANAVGEPASRPGTRQQVGSGS